MPTKFVACLLLIAGQLAGQGGSGRVSPASARSGTVSWTAADTILIGELSGGTLAASGARLRCTGLLQAHRVLKGDAVPGSQFSLAWEFEPTLPVNARAGVPLPPQYGLWMLERTVEGSLRPLRFPPPSNALGGYYVPFPPTQPSGSLAYTNEAPLDRKLAAELAAAMESIASTAGDNLNVKWTVPPSEGGGRLSESASRFQPLVRLLLSTGYSSAAPVFQYLSESSYPNLRSAGIVGRLRGGDAEAALALERDASRLADTVAMFDLSSTLMSFRWQDDLPAAHALARTALGDTQLPGLETVAAARVSSLRKMEFLPYLAVMLESPNTGNRDTALMGLCTMVRQTPIQPTDFGGLWKPEMQQYCPNHSPLQDPAEERVYLDFWRQWWADNREKVQADPNVPRPVAPARYFSNAAVAGERIPVPMTRRLGMFVNMAASFKRGREARRGLPRTNPLRVACWGLA